MSALFNDPPPAREVDDRPPEIEGYCEWDGVWFTIAEAIWKLATTRPWFTCNDVLECAKLQHAGPRILELPLWYARRNKVAELDQDGTIRSMRFGHGNDGDGDAWAGDQEIPP